MLVILDNFIMIIGILFLLIIGLITLWAFISGVLFNKETYTLSSWIGENADSNVIFTRIFLLVTPVFIIAIISSDFTKYYLYSFPQTLEDFKSGVLADAKSFSSILFVIFIALFLLTLGGGLMYFIFLGLAKAIKLIASIPLKKIKVHYKWLLTNINQIDYINKHFGYLRLNRIKSNIMDFTSINNLPFDFKKDFFLLPGSFNKKRDGSYFDYSNRKYKNLQEFVNLSTKWDNIKINRKNYLNFFSNNFFSKTLLKLKGLVNFSYLPISLIITISSYCFFKHLLLLPSIYTIFHLLLFNKILKKDYSDLKFSFDVWGVYIIISGSALIIPFLIYLEIQKNFVGYTYESQFLFIDLILMFLVFLFVLLIDLYNYYIELYMNCIFNRILINEQLFCFFYTLNCFEIHLDKWMNEEKFPLNQSKEHFVIKFNPENDF